MDERRRQDVSVSAWIWYHTVIGGNRCPIVDTWWQTETGSIMITPLPGAIPQKPEGQAVIPVYLLAQLSILCHAYQRLVEDFEPEYNLTGCFSDRHGCKSCHPIGSKRGAGELFRVKNASNFRGHS